MNLYTAFALIAEQQLPTIEAKIDRLEKRIDTLLAIVGQPEQVVRLEITAAAPQTKRRA